MIEFEAEGDCWLMEKSGVYDCIEELVLIDGVEIKANEEFYKYAKTHLSSAYGKMVTTPLVD